MPDIRVLSGQGFVDTTVNATTIEQLRTELNMGESSAVSVNGKNVTNATTISDGDMVAAVSNNKTGGDKS